MTYVNGVLVVAAGNLLLLLNGAIGIEALLVVKLMLPHKLTRLRA